MRRTIFKSKIVHRATVTHADLDYEGFRHARCRPDARRRTSCL